MKKCKAIIIIIGLYQSVQSKEICDSGFSSLEVTPGTTPRDGCIYRHLMGTRHQCSPSSLSNNDSDDYRESPYFSSESSFGSRSTSPDIDCFQPNKKQEPVLFDLKNELSRTETGLEKDEVSKKALLRVLPRYCNGMALEDLQTIEQRQEKYDKNQKDLRQKLSEQNKNSIPWFYKNREGQYDPLCQTEEGSLGKEWKMIGKALRYCRNAMFETDIKKKDDVEGCHTEFRKIYGRYVKIQKQKVSQEQETSSYNKKRKKQQQKLIKRVNSLREMCNDQSVKNARCSNDIAMKIFEAGLVLQAMADRRGMFK